MKNLYNTELSTLKNHHVDGTCQCKFTITDGGGLYLLDGYYNTLLGEKTLKRGWYTDNFEYVAPLTDHDQQLINITPIF